MPRIRDIFFDPSMAVARLGSSSSPQVAYEWAQTPNPRVEGETSVRPAWSLNVLADGTVSPFMPDRVAFRDGANIRPVCPFLEVWAVLGDSDDPATWTEAPLTPALLAENGVTLSALQFVVNARNRKAERRTGLARLRYGTYPAVRVRGDEHTAVALLGRSPPGSNPRMIPAGRSIPLGSFQVLRSRAQPAPNAASWASEVNVEVVRCRLTPARGFVYGPPQTANPLPDGSVPVDSSRAFLEESAGWAGATVNQLVEPADTFDGAENGTSGLGASMGIVDDTCEVHVEARLTLGSGVLTGRANVFVAPPDFAPDRRPFLSIADELNDRAAGQSERSQRMSAAEVTAWVQDLFERVYETVSLTNVDYWRALRSISLPAAARRSAPIPGDAVPQPSRAGGGLDRLRNELFPVAAPSGNQPLPLTEHARMRHRALADVDQLRDFVAQNPGRLRSLVRAVFECEAAENGRATTLRMPPFMRGSNALPLTLSAWQYDLLMRWVSNIEQGGAIADLAAEGPAPLSAGAESRRREVLDRLGEP
ncbi:MAG TPA: hypothetical protein VFQ61_21805 [Polyangiaceae bacterium]|nr:hypothetical protein [Polyangiaceae bacterium]